MATQPVYKSVLILSLLLFSTSSFSQKKADIKAILENFNQQEICWNKKDTRCYCEAYADLDSVRTISRAGVIYGKANILKSYQTNWTPERMGELNFDKMHLEMIDPKHYLVTGRFNLDYSNSKTLSGYFSVIMIKIKGEWKIYTDHSS